MNILLTNDDGYNSLGIRFLQEILKRKHNVFFCAPLNQTSGISHAITLFKPLELVKLNDYSYALNGTPADCVKVSLFYLFKNINFDLIISGINDGPNMGEDVFYSGTVAAAREGLMNNISSIAASLDGWDGIRYFESAAESLDKIIDNLNNNILTKKILLNINFPNKKKHNKIRITCLGERIYNDFVIKEEKDNKIYLKITGDNPSFKPKSGSDLDAVYEGNISITPLANEIFDTNLLESIKYIENIEL